MPLRQECKIGIFLTGVWCGRPRIKISGGSSGQVFGGLFVCVRVFMAKIILVKAFFFFFFFFFFLKLILRHELTSLF